MPSQIHSPKFRFAEYELDVRTGELKKSGHKIPLPSQAIQLLALLLERAGDVVTREELYAALWPTGTVVEFDHGINSSIRRLRAALNDSADRPRYIETLPKRGYRFIFRVEPGERAPAQIGTESRAIAKEDSAISGPRRSWLWAAGGVVGICMLIGFGLMQWRTARGQSIDSIAVLPLVNATNDASAEYLSDGIAEEIINALSTAPHLKVIARTSAFRFRGKEVDPRRVGRELGVGAVLTGTLARHGDELVIQTDLVKVSDGSELWGTRINRPLAQLQTVQAEIAPEIASKLQLRLNGNEQKQLAKRYTDDSEAYELYLKAAHTEDSSERIRYLKRSIARDPKFALGYARLADEYGGMADVRSMATKEAYVKVREAATKALELDGSLGEAHVELALAFMNADWDWRSAERELKRAIELNPNTGHTEYALYQMQVGRRQESLVEAQRAEQVDPLSAQVQGLTNLVYWGARQYDKTLERARAFGLTSGILQQSAAFALAEMGRYGESIELLKPFANAGAGSQGHLGYAYAKAGNRAEAERIISRLKQRAEKESVGAYEVAFIDGVLGRREEAFQWLEIAFQQHDAGLKFLKMDPCLDPLRSDPRLNGLIRRVGLTP